MFTACSKYLFIHNLFCLLLPLLTYALIAVIHSMALLVIPVFIYVPLKCVILMTYL